MLRELPALGQRLRITPRSRQPFEGALTEAAARGRQGALQRTADRLGGFDIAGLSQNVDCKSPLLLDVASSFLADLDAASAVDRCLRTMDARAGHSRIADGTRRAVIPEFDDVYWASHGEAGTTEIRSFAVHELIRKGMTLVVNNLQPRMGGALRDFVNDLDRSLGLDAQVNLYLSEREAPGFGRHWDDHDVLILQTMGRKHWTLFEPTALSPRLGATPAREFGAPIFSIILEPGAALFIPRGWGHEVSGFEGEMSMHYTVGMRPITGNDVLEVARATRPPEDLARVASPETASEQGQFLDQALLEHALGDHRWRITTTPANGVVEIYTAALGGFAGKSFRAPLPGGCIFADPSDQGRGSIAFAAGGYLFEAEPAARDLLVNLFAGSAVPAARAGSAEHLTALLQLARRGIVDMVDDTTIEVSAPEERAV